MAAFNRLADGVAGDVGGLIDAADRAVRGAMAAAEPSSPVADQLGSAAGSLRRAMLIVRQLELLSGRTAPPLHRREFGDAVTEAMTLVRRLAGPAVIVDERLEAAGVELRLSSGALEQILMHLAVNARDAMPGGGRLAVRTRISHTMAPTVHRFGVIGKGTWAVLEVTDSGCGIPADHLEQLFDPFFTTKGPGAGSGLGLTTVLSIVRQCGGHVTVDSAPGSGSTFSIWFPAEEVAPTPVRSMSVLVADEDPWVRAAAARALRRAGHGVLEASDPATLGEVIAGVAGSALDVIVVDRELAGGDPALLDGILRGAHPETRIVFMVEGAACGTVGRGWLGKPFSGEDLLARVAG